MSNGLSEIFISSKEPANLGSFQEVGLSAKVPSTATGLSATTQYYFKVDGVEYNITTGASVLYNDVIPLMNAQVRSAGKSFILEGGDLRCVNSNATTVLAAGTTGADLFATLTGWASFDVAVNGILYAKVLIPGRRALFKQMRVNLPISFTGDIEWTLQKATGDRYDQKFTDALSGVTSYYNGSVDLYCGSGDSIIITTSAACGGCPSYLELTFLGTGI